MTNPVGEVALRPGAVPAVPMPEMSRRSFLKLLGASIVVMSVPAIGSGLSPAAVRAPDAGVLIPALSARPKDVPLQSPPAHTIDLLQQAFDELCALGFPFLLDQGSVYQHPQRPNLYGALFQDTVLAPRHLGADIAFTLDAEAPERSTLTYLVGRSEEDGLHLAATVLTAQGKRLQTSMVALRDDDDATRGPARHILRNALLANTWTNASDAGAREPVLIEHTAWYYGHGTTPIWTLVRGADGHNAPQLRLTHSQEFRDTRQVIAGQARFDGWQSEVRTIELYPGLSVHTADRKADEGKESD
jgi:hypothetical protein